MNRINWHLCGAIIVLAWLILFLYSVRVSLARDLGQWENSDPDLSAWYKSLMMPDHPQSPCCGEADAYYTTFPYVRDGKVYAKIDDDRPDEPRQRPHIDNGTEIEIPDYKLKYDRGNPTGRGIVFLSPKLFVYCYVQPGGV